MDPSSSDMRRKLVLLNVEIVYGPQFQQYSQKTCPIKHGVGGCLMQLSIKLLGIFITAL